MRTLFLGLLVLTSGCATVLKVRVPTGPEASLGAVKTLSLDVATDMSRSVERSIVSGLTRGAVPIPVPVHSVVKERLASRLEQLGYAVCPAAPCGDGAMSVELVESDVNTEFTQNGPRVRAHVKARVKVTQGTDGALVYDYSFWDTRSGSADRAGQLVGLVADHIANRFVATLTPGVQRVEFHLEDGGPLTTGVNMLMSSNWDGAVAYFTDLTRQQPELDGAWYDLGVAWEVKGDWTQALGAYEQAAARARKRVYLDAVANARRVAPAPVQPIPVE